MGVPPGRLRMCTTTTKVSNINDCPFLERIRTTQSCLRHRDAPLTVQGETTAATYAQFWQRILNPSFTYDTPGTYTVSLTEVTELALTQVITTLGGGWGGDILHPTPISC